MKGKCNDPFRRIQEEDTEGGGGGGGVLVEWHSAVSSSFCGVDREGKGKAREREGEGRRSEKGGGRGGSTKCRLRVTVREGSLYRRPLSGRWIAATSYCVSAPI